MSDIKAGQPAKEAAPSLRDSIADAFDKEADPTPAPAADAPAPEAAAPAKDGPAPAAATGAEDAPAADASPKAAGDQPPADGSGKPADPQAAAALKPPPGFPGGDAAWNALPVPAREWAKARERQFDQYIRANAEASKFGGTMWKAVQPYEAMLRSQGVHPAQVVAEAMNMHYVLSMAPQAEKAAALQRMAKQYGVELPMGDDGQAQAPQSDPRVDRLEMALRQMAGRAMQAEEQQVQQQFFAATQSVDEFAKDPQHEHIRHPGVVDTMANLIDTGAAQGLKQAYDMAIWTRPELRAVLLEKDAARRAAEARAATHAAPARGGAPVAAVMSPNNGSVRSAIESAWEGQTSRRVA